MTSSGLGIVLMVVIIAIFIMTIAAIFFLNDDYD